jgi:alcohol dehydrogenase
MVDILSLQFPNTLIGTGSVSAIAGLAKKSGVQKVLIITDQGIVQTGIIDKIKSSLADTGIEIGVYDNCLPDAPSNVIEHCAQKVVEGNYGLLVGVGGGSVLDTTKVVSLVASTGKKVQDFIGLEEIEADRVIPKILIPTTAGTGSEWTAVAVVTDKTDGKKKRVGRAPCLMADTAIIDPELTLGLPQKITADTGFDVLAHAIEAYVSTKATIVGDMFAEKTIELVANNLREAYTTGKNNITARHNMAVAATLAAGALQASHAGLAHCMDGLIVEKAKISHGAALGILLPHVMEFNRIAAPEKFARIARLMGEDTANMSDKDAAAKAPGAVRKLSDDLEMIGQMEKVGVKSEDIPELVGSFMKNWIGLANMINPREATSEDIEGVFMAAL